MDAFSVFDGGSGRLVGRGESPRAVVRL